MTEKRTVTTTGTVSGGSRVAHFDIDDSKRTGAVKIAEDLIRVLLQGAAFEGHEFGDLSMGSGTLGYDFLTGCLEEVYKGITHTV